MKPAAMERADALALELNRELSELRARAGRVISYRARLDRAYQLVLATSKASRGERMQAEGDALQALTDTLRDCREQLGPDPLRTAEETVRLQRIEIEEWRRAMAETDTGYEGPEGLSEMVDDLVGRERGMDHAYRLASDALADWRLSARLHILEQETADEAVLALVEELSVAIDGMDGHW